MFTAATITSLGLAQQVEADVAWVATDTDAGLLLDSLGSFENIDVADIVFRFTATPSVPNGVDVEENGDVITINVTELTPPYGNASENLTQWDGGGIKTNVSGLGGLLGSQGDLVFSQGSKVGIFGLVSVGGGGFNVLLDSSDFDSVAKTITPTASMTFDGETIESVFGSSFLADGPVALWMANDTGDVIYLLDEAVESGRAESYAGAVDYALHATRNITETVMQTTPFAAGSSTAQHDEKGNLVGSSDVAGHSLQAFGGYYGLSMESDSSKSGHDYDLDSNGGYAGVRAKAGDSLSYGGFVAVDNGSVDSAGLDLDADGYVVGLFAHYAACEKVGLWANVSYGDFSFDGDRRLPNGSMTLDVEEFDSEALQIGIGADYEAYNRDGLRVSTGLGLRYIDASTDSITETGGVAALEIDGIDAESLLLDFIVKLAYTPEGAQYGLSAYLGYQHDFEDGEREIDAALSTGGNDYRILAPGLGDSAFLYGAGGYYDVTEDLRFSAGYRGETRSDAEDTQSVDLRVTYGF